MYCFNLSVLCFSEEDDVSNCAVPVSTAVIKQIISRSTADQKQHNLLHHFYGEKTPQHPAWPYTSRDAHRYKHTHHRFIIYSFQTHTHTHVIIMTVVKLQTQKFCLIHPDVFWAFLIFNKTDLSSDTHKHRPDMNMNLTWIHWFSCILFCYGACLKMQKGRRRSVESSEETSLSCVWLSQMLNDEFMWIKACDVLIRCVEQVESGVVQWDSPMQVRLSVWRWGLNTLMVEVVPWALLLNRSHWDLWLFEAENIITQIPAGKTIIPPNFKVCLSLSLYDEC